MVHNLARVLFLAASAAACSGPAATGPSSGHSPSGECTDIGCVDGLTLSLKPTSGWKPGAYLFTIVADGVTQTCKGALPLPPCEGGRGLTCTGDVATIGESGCALPQSAHGFADVQFRSGPSKVAFRVERDGTALADVSLTPAYRTTQPNGPNCGPVCRQAAAEVVLKDP